VTASLPPGYRNEFHAGFHRVWPVFRFGAATTSGSTPTTASTSACWETRPIFFPIDWRNSKIPGFAANASMPNFHGFSAEVVLSRVAARFFPPQVGGLGTTVGQNGLPFRIDHDEKFNETTHMQYQFTKQGLLNGSGREGTGATTPVRLPEPCPSPRCHHPRGPDWAHL